MVYTIKKTPGVAQKLLKFSSTSLAQNTEKTLHSFNTYLLRAYDVPGTEERAEEGKGLCSRNSRSSREAMW